MTTDTPIFLLGPTASGKHEIAILLAVVLPLLPEEAHDPWKVLAPRRIGLFVTLIMGVDYVGYILHRTLGARRGAGLTGLLGGLTSSTLLNLLVLPPKAYASSTQ